VFRNYDPNLRPQEKAVEYVRALNSAKLDKVVLHSNQIVWILFGNFGNLGVQFHCFSFFVYATFNAIVLVFGFGHLGFELDSFCVWMRIWGLVCLTWANCFCLFVCFFFFSLGWVRFLQGRFSEQWMGIWMRFRVWQRTRII
jgi:hypothetical protein